MAGQEPDPYQWGPHVQPHVQNSPAQGNYQQQYPPQYPPPPQSPYPPPHVQVNVQQYAYGPGRAVTQQNMGCMEEAFHWTMIVCTCGLWLPVYLSRKRSMRSVTTFR